MSDNPARRTGLPARPSNAATSPSTQRSSASRRLRYGLSSLALILCACISLALANLIALDPRLRIVADVTATGEHRLAPRTQSVLASLPPGYEIIIAGAGDSDPAVRRRVADVLDSLARTNRLTVTWIDDPAGPDYASLITRLVERDRPALATASTALSTSADELDRAADLLTRTGDALGNIAALIPAPASASPTTPAALARQQLTEYAAIARTMATDSRANAQNIRATLAQTSGPGVPPLDTAANIARRALSRLASELQSLAAALTALASADSTPREAALRAQSLNQQLTLGRDPIALAADRATALAIPDLVRVARVLESSQAVLVVSPDRLGAIAFGTLFPASIPQTVGGARADIGAAAEDLLASSIASLAAPASPIVVLMHASGDANQPGGSPSPDPRLLDRGAINALLERLALRRIDVVEWRVAAEQEPPSLASLNPDFARPVVYVVLGATSFSNPTGPSSLGGADRVQRLAAAVRRLADRGSPILLCLPPSSMPAFGGADAQAALLADFGLRADSGRPLLSERILGGRRIVDTDRLVTASTDTDHPIASATATLAIGLPWVLPIESIDAQADGPPGVRLERTALITVSTPATWGESQWLNYRNIPPEQRAQAGQAAPTPDADRDDTTGPWTIAWAVQRSTPALADPQRLVAIGSTGWFFDALAAQSEVVNGRVVPTLPGNGELFEAAVFWLAGQEEFIARSAAAGSVPTIRPLTPTQSTIIHWLVLAILPLGTLALGVACRVIRG